MRSRKPHLSLRQFERRHPDLDVRVSKKVDMPWVVIARNREGAVVAMASGPTREEALATLSERCYRVARLRNAEAQGWRGGNTGELGQPLEAHHKLRRSKGRDDSRENLVLVTRDVHNAQHD
jgi:hypothetical protein